MGWMIALPIGAGVLLGRLLDNALGTQPYGTISLLGLGIGIAGVEGWLAASRALKAAKPK